MTTEEDDESSTTRDEPAICSQEEGGSSCTICMEEWTIGGEHRLCCLKCGHLFGRSCIERWIKEKGSNSKCPSCNKPARRPDLRDLWCKNIRATDHTELTQLQELLANERKSRKSDSAVIFQQDLRLKIMEGEITKLKKDVIERDSRILRLERMIDSYNKTRNNLPLIVEPDLECQEAVTIDVDIPPKELKGKFHLAEKLDSCSAGSCKAFALCPTALNILVAQTAPPELRAGVFACSPYGIRRYSTFDSNIKHFIPLHSKPINSIQLKPHGDLLLTAGQDRKVRLTSVTNNCCIQTYNSDHEPTCVAWSAHRDQQFYVASGNCYVTLFDLRNTSEYIYQTPRRVAKTRLLYITATSLFGNSNGLIVNDLKGSQYLEVSENSEYYEENIDRSLEHLTSYNLPFEGLMGSVDFNKSLNLSLISTRRSTSSPNLTHHLIQLQKAQDDEGNSYIQTNSVRTFTGGSTGEQPLLSQSRILKHPTLNDSVLVGASDQAARGVMLWDSSDNCTYQTIRTERYVRDMIMYTPENSNQHMLYLLSEVGLNIYRWDYA